MADSTQTYKNHFRTFPPFHFVVLPVLLINFLINIYRTYQAPSFTTAWGIVLGFTFLLLAVASRVMSLTVQDRVIRLEMRLRLMGLLPPDLQGRVGELTRQQMVALRFASDAELPRLVREVLTGKLQTQKAIKEQVRDWQGDYLRC